MKKIIAYIILLISLLANTTVSMAQETRVTGTLKVHPWLNLPVVISTDIKGGLQSFGSMPVNLSGTTISDTLNVKFPIFKREIGMVSTVIDYTTNKTRYFEYYALNTWREIYVIYGWEAGRAYAIGDYVAYNGNFYVANIVHTSSPAFVTDLLKWDNAGGKDGKYTIKEMKMDSATLNMVAVHNSVIVPGTEDNTIATVGYALNTFFDGNRVVTRPNWTGVSGANMKTSNVIDFLNRVFFPILSPYVDYFRYNDVGNHGDATVSYQNLLDPLLQTFDPRVGTVTIDYATWSPLANFIFKYNITKQDVNAKITKIEILDPADHVISKVEGPDLPTSGSFSIPKPAVNYTKVSLQISDGTNVVKLALNTTFVGLAGVKITKAYVSLTSGVGSLEYNSGVGSGSNVDPYLIERNGSNRDYFFNWAYDKQNDATVVGVKFTGTPTIVDLPETGDYYTTTYKSIQFLNDRPLTPAPLYQNTVSAKGDVAKSYSTPVFPSKYYELRDRTYYGYLKASQVASPTESDIKGLAGAKDASSVNGTLNTPNYYSIGSGPTKTDDTGITATNTLGESGFFTWAVPTYVSGSLAMPSAPFKAYYFYDPLWRPLLITSGAGKNVTFTYVKMTTAGTNSTWYWVCIYAASVGNGNSVQAILSK